MLYVYLILDKEKFNNEIKISVKLGGKDQADLEKNALEIIEEYGALGLPLKRVSFWVYIWYLVFG